MLIRTEAEMEVERRRGDADLLGLSVRGVKTSTMNQNRCEDVGSGGAHSQ